MNVRFTDRSEPVVKILDTADSGSLLFIGQKGTAVYRDARLQTEAEFHWDLCSDSQKHPTTTCLKSRKASFTVTDAVYLDVGGHYCIATTNRTLHFMRASPAIQWETFRITELPTVPTCLASSFQSTNKEKTCDLFIGDHKGGIYVLTFFFPSTMLFSRKYSLDTQVIRFNDLDLHKNYVKWRHIKRVHSDLVNNLQYISQRNILFSCSNLDSEKSLVSQDLTSSRIDVYFHPVSITCFECNHHLNVVATGSKEFSIRIFRIGSCSETVAVLTGHKAVVADLRIYSTTSLLSICKEGEVCKWDLKSYTCLKRIMFRLLSFYPPVTQGNSILHISSHHSNHILVTFKNLTFDLDLNEFKELDYITLK